MCSGCTVNNGVVSIAYQFEPEWCPDNISEEDRAEPVQAQDVSELYFVLFVVVCLIRLDAVLFVNATAYVIF